MGDSSRPENKYIPDAEGYPLAVTRYTGDNTGRVSVQGGVGKLFQPGPAAISKATRYFYGKPEQWELDRLFGNDIGYASHYLKNMTIDGNGQISISYQDAAGKTIATALTGETPDNVDSLPSKPTAVQKATVLMNREFSFDPSKMKISATATYMNAVPGSVKLTLDIQQLISKYAENNVNICSNCYYEGGILITDNCGNEIYRNATPMKIGSMVSNCDEEVFNSTEIDSIIMDVGEYFITFELGIPEAAITSYARNYVAKNTNLKTEWAFVSDALFNKDFLSCFNDCATCKEQLGELTEFSQRIKERLLADGVKVPENDTTITTWINNLYASLSSQCATLRMNCATSTPCTNLENDMKKDVSPGGQYALFDDSTNAVEPTINVLNLNWRQVFKPLPKDSLRYIQEQFELEDGKITSPYDSAFTLKLLVKYWKSEWASYFVQYHPEYCALQFCRDNVAYLQWDDNLRTQTKTISDIPSHVIGAYYSSTTIRWLVDHDPFFSFGGKGYGLAPAFIDDLTNYSKNIAGAKDGTPIGSLSKFVLYMLYCADYTGSTNINNDPVKEADNWSDCVPNDSCRVKDREWSLYREKYLELKNKYYQLLRNTPAYCGAACTVGKASAYPVINCPDASTFVLANDGDCTKDLYRCKVTYLGAALSQKLKIKVYYPDEYRDLIIYQEVELAAGNTVTAFCVNKAIPLSALRVASTNCGTAAGDTAFSCAVDAQVDKFERVTSDYEDGFSTVEYTYTGHIPPVGAAIRALVRWPSIDRESAPRIYIDHSYDRRPIEIHQYGQIDNWILEIDTCYEATTTPVTGCNQAYAYKTSRITNISYATPAITTDTIVLKGIVNDAMAAMINQNCEAQADVWMGALSGLLDRAEYVGYKFTIRKKLIEVCKLGGDAEHINGASTLPNNRATAEGYKSFADVLEGVLPIDYNMDCNPYLISAPYPYDVKPQPVEKVIDATNAAICERLAALTAEFNAAQTTDSFYTYLVQKYGQAMNITKDELKFLQKGCTNCRYLLQQPVKLPVFMEKGAKGCISASEYTNAGIAFAAIMGDSLIVDHPNYEVMFANYFNGLFGFTLSYAEYKEYGDTVAKNPSLSMLLCNHPVYASVKQDNYECLMQVIDDAATAGHVAYKEYIEEVKRLFRAEYIAYCSANKPKVSLTSPQQTYHYTLYYYDQAGNLVRTVPPEGVHPLDDSLFAQIAAVRRKGNITCSDTVPSVNTPETTALQQFTTVFDRTGDAALEMWMFNQNRSGGKVIATTSGNKYIFNLCISGKYLNFDVYTITPLAGGETDVVLSGHTTADLTGILPLTPWTHVVIQGDGLKKNSREIFVNGKSCPRVTVEPTGACPWEIRSGGAGITYPKNLTLLKQARFFNRKLNAQEISANADDACLGFSPAYATALDSAKLFWMRFGIPAPGSYWTVNGTTTETQFVPVFPKHTLTTSYAYQSLNGIETQHTPDGGTSHFWYDMLGRMVASQNAEQLTPMGGGLGARYSYTNYDTQGRIKEVGETKSSLPDTVPFLSTDALVVFGANPKQQVTRTYYDAPKSQTVATIADAQDNLRKRVSAVTYGEDANGNPQQATHYSYDQLGNVKTLWQQMVDLDTKQIDYQYDLVSGKVNTVRYQVGKPDQFLYGYEYDAENRLTKAFTGVNTVSSNGWVIETPHTDAAYRYYLHGPLARTELGNEQLVQGIDYAYTLQGWLKGVNGNYLSPQDEIGRDGVPHTWRGNIARDAYAYSLEYFKDDYKPVSGEAKAFPLTWTVGLPSEAGRDLFNGNISRSTLALKRIEEDKPVGYSYRYDQLNRLKGMRQHPLTVGTNAWSDSTAHDQFKEAITYDGNGNILSYLRNGGSRGLAMDQLSYVYSRDAAGNLLNNRLSQVTDAVNNAGYTEDLKSQPVNNYLYDNIGNLLSDKQGKIDSIRWTLYGKIRQISKADTSSLEYKYDAAGNRVYKQYTKNNIAERTWYVRDAQGNVLAVYGNKGGDNRKYWQEQHLYGSSRFGIWTSDVDATDMTAVPSDTNWLKKGRKEYELTNHLGNVLATISDKVVDSVIGGAVVHYDAEVLSAQDYYPFGMLQPDRKWSLGSYRYGFNGKENDNEVKGEGNQQDYGMRVYDPRLGKFLSVDPLMKDYPELTPYQFASNRPIDANDLDGAESSHWDPVRRQWMMPSDAIRHPLPPGAFMPSNEAAKGAGDRPSPEIIVPAAAALVVAGAPAVAASAGSTFWRIAGWAAQPRNQMLVGETVTFTAGVLNPGPEDVSPGSGADELGRVSRQAIKKAIGSAERFLWKNLSGLCFVAGTKIHTAYGDKNIEDIQAGDSVWSFKQLVIDSTGMCQLKRVVRVYRNHVSKLVRVNVGNDQRHSLLTTTEHPFFVNGRWIEAGKLKAGDPLKTLNGFDCEVVSIQRLDTSDIQVFNFEVEENHNYFVGEDGVLVHNNCDEKWLSATYSYGKHVLFGSANRELRNKSWKDIVKSTKTGEALYKSLIPAEVRTLEQTAMEKGIKLNIKKGVVYYVYDAGEVIGATGGKEASHLRVEVTSTGQYHGHPLSEQEYKHYVKKYGQ